MTLRTRQKMLYLIVGVPAVGVLGSIAWIVWYDMNAGPIAALNSPNSGNDTAPLPDFSTRAIEMKIRQTRRTLQHDGLLGLHVARFQRRAGKYPDRLTDLLHKPPDLTKKHWDGPYVSGVDMLNDPWGKTYQYCCPGTHNPQSYDLWSVGPDGVGHTADDIGNW